MKKIYQERYYKNIRPEYLKKEEAEQEYWIITYQDKLHTFKKYLKPNQRKLLDIGCGGGFFLACAKDNGWEVLGIEPSKVAAEHAKKLGIPIVQTSIEKIDIKNLEHLMLST